MTARLRAALGLTLLLAGAPAMAIAQGGPVAIDQPQFKGVLPLHVMIGDLGPNEALPLSYTASGRNTSPPLTWTPGPRGALTYVVLVQDPDAPSSEPAVHWLVWNIPEAVTGLPKGMRNIASPTVPLGCAQGQNFHGSVGYSGPRPPLGDPPHHYHFQVFALDRKLRVRPGDEPRSVLAAMAGHVRASGELVATFAAPVPKAPKAAAPASG